MEIGRASPPLLARRGAVNEPCLLNLLFVSVNRLDNSKLAEGKTSSREVVKLVQHDSLIERVFFFGRRVVVGRHPRISETKVSLPSLAKLYKDERIVLSGEQGGVEVDSSDEWIKSSSTSLWEEDHISSKVRVKGVVGW